MHYGMANTSGQPSKVQAFDILDEAAKAGVNSLDTSVDYGTSEEVIGEYRKERDASFFITSKFRVGGDKPEADLVREAELSVNRLQKIDMFFFHSGEEMVAHADRLEEPMKRLMESGMIRFPGASV